TGIGGVSARNEDRTNRPSRSSGLGAAILRPGSRGRRGEDRARDQSGRPMFQAPRQGFRRDEILSTPRPRSNLPPFGSRGKDATLRRNSVSPRDSGPNPTPRDAGIPDVRGKRAPPRRGSDGRLLLAARGRPRPATGRRITSPDEAGSGLPGGESAD